MAPVGSLADLHPALAAQWHPTANAPLTPDVTAPSSRKPVAWVCPTDPAHVWKASPTSRVYNNSGCPWCAGNRVTPSRSLLTRFPDVARDWHPTRNGALGPADVHAGSTRRVWWRCRKDPKHVWQAVIRIRTEPGAGLACPTCAPRRPTSRSSLAARFPDLAEEWHPTRNGALRPSDIRMSSPLRIWWRCRRDPSHEWRTQARSRTVTGSGCPMCSGRVATPETSLAAIFPRIAEEWHPTRNRRLGPGNVMPHSSRKVWWQCRKDATHAWRARMLDRTKVPPTGCPACSNHMVTPENSLAARAPAVAAEWHPTKNGRLRPDHVVAGTARKVWWQCQINPKHVWRAVVCSRTNQGVGCPVCANRLVTPDNCLSTLQPELARQWHPTRNGSLTAGDVTPGSMKNVWWRCPLNPAHEWRSNVSNRTHGSGCPDCYREGVRRRALRGTERAEADPALRGRARPR